MAEIMKKLANMKKPMIAILSGANLTLGTRPFLRHARESGCQEIDRRTKKRGCSKVVRASRRALLGAPQHEVIL
jgi:hypothetical protein